MTELLAALVLFAASASFTPGPNNVMLTASGATFGFRRTVPHILGVVLGFPAMVAAVGLGLGTVLAAIPAIHVVLKYVGAAYLCYLAWLVATSGRSGGAEAAGSPLGFWRAAAFQWVNPKGWVMAVGAISTFTSTDGNIVRDVLLIALVFLLVGLPSTMTWTVFGTLIGRWLGSDRRLRLFNMAMGALLLLSVIPALA